MKTMLIVLVLTGAAYAADQSQCPAAAARLKSMVDTLDEVITAGTKVDAKNAKIESDIVALNVSITDLKKKLADVATTNPLLKSAQTFPVERLALQTLASGAQKDYVDDANEGHKAWKRYVETFKDLGDGQVESAAKHAECVCWVAPTAITSKSPEADLAAYEAFVKLLEAGWKPMNAVIGTGKQARARGQADVIAHSLEYNFCEKLTEGLSPAQRDKLTAAKTDTSLKKDVELAKLRRMRVENDKKDGTQDKNTADYFNDEEKFKDDPTDKGTASIDTKSGVIKISKGGNLWEVAKQLVGQNASNAQVAKIVAQMKKSVKSNSKGSKPGVLYEGDTINIADLNV